MLLAADKSVIDSLKFTMQLLNDARISTIEFQKSIQTLHTIPPENKYAIVTGYSYFKRGLPNSFNSA